MKINKLYRLLTLACLMLSCFCNVAIAQTEGTEVKATVIDEQGNPINKVNVFGPNGIQSSTDVNGQFQIKLLSDETVVIQKKGYESELINMTDLTEEITLVKSAFLANEDDQIKMGVATKHRRDIVGAVSSINTKDRLTYDNTQWVRDYINGLMLGVEGSANVRGLGNAVFVIDGVIGRDPNILNMEEVEQITVLKDANSVALYGSQGRNGVIIINTKRGKINKKEVNVNVRSGIRTPLALPNYLGSVQYMELYNEARNNDGLDNFFEPSLIEEFRSSTNKFRYPDIDFYSSEYLQPFVNSTNVVTEFSGGNDKSQYYVNAGWTGNEEWVRTNSDANAGTNRFNLRANIDFKVNDWITSSIDGIAIINSDKSALSNLLSAGTTFRPNDYSPLLPVSMVDTEANPELAAQLEAAGIFDGMLLGSTQQFQENTPVANAIAGGYQNDVFRSTQFNNSIDFNLDRITEGLSAKTYLSFDFYDSYKLSIRNKYRVYEPTWEDDKIIALTAFGDVDQKDLTENVSTNGFVSRLGFYGLVNYQKTIGTSHSINSTFLGYYNSEKRNSVLQKDIDSHFGFQLAYDYKKKMFVDFSGSYVHSIKLPEGNRGGLSPTLGVAYILSEESFLKESNFVDYLKLKASGGIIKSDKGINGYYLYGEDYSNGGTFNWADGQSSNRRQDISQGANPNMGYEERIDLNIGLEGYLWNSLWFEFNYFKSDLDKQLTFLTDKYPSYYNTFRPRDNYNKNSFKGFEIGANYKKAINDFTVSLGANILYSESIATKRSEVNEFDYQNRVGRETSTIFGLVDQGFYSEADFNVDGEGNTVLNDGLPVPGFGAVLPGDLKYKDQNGDNIIDNDDRVAIGQSSSPFSYGVNLNLNYKAFNLFILGTGQTGGDAIRSNSYFQVNGNDKYSEVVLGRWTPQTASTATFPRLSTQTNQNNFGTSTFWLYDNSFFKINRAQLTYEFNETLSNKLGMNDFSLNFQGTNILELSKNRDIRQLTIGEAPQFRSYTLGVRMLF
ncbi:SusC/RagA family TonB-linked outer membrane protein [Algibacter miyuki]|uniref:SusC/RagA family TonB-linked outer membrane protein n=1 Tax=Algibacter miyuki TaxID=1306933 RepID=A0ABV5H3H3_9FLAO|nr:SusC/RagA family TonB-linked outer membrane protein [Algibacter miyuki]MDN3663939.1 SusC/RagA family TonB-linked outer membrane protein [Algibacter miyuki]